METNNALSVHLRESVHYKRDQSWVFFGRNDAKAETPVLWPPHAKNWLIGKDSDAGRDWGQEEKGTTEDEMAEWHHLLDERESEWTPGVGDGQGGLVCCDSWDRKESDTTERLNWAVQFSQHYSLKRLFLHYIFLSPLSSINCKYVDWLLGPHFCSIHLCVCFCATTILF